MVAVRSPDGPDAGAPWHYGDPFAEQRRLVGGSAAVDISHLGIVEVRGSDRLAWLHSLTSGYLEDLAPANSATSLILDPHGHVQHLLRVVEFTDERTVLVVEPDEVPALVRYLDSMRFLLDVSVRDASAELAAVWVTGQMPHEIALGVWLPPVEFRGEGTTAAGADRGGDASKYVPVRPAVLPGGIAVVPRDAVGQVMAEVGGKAGVWALEALRVAAVFPRIGLETDHRTLPHELGLIGPAVHLAKGCYRGQETVARVHNMGRPPRRIALAHLDGSVDQLPEHGDEVHWRDRKVGWVGTAARHYELGPIATIILKRSVDPRAELVAGGVAAGQETVVVAG